jgi:hypothetical protein
LRTIKRLQAYVPGLSNSSKDAARLDNVRETTETSIEDIGNGQYRFLQGSPTRVTQILTFCTALQDRIQELPTGARDKPFTKSHKYVGYSISVSTRIKERENTDTSWLHHMIQDASRLELEDEKPLFRFDTYAVCFLFRDEGRVAEALIGVISNSMIETGGGFDVCQDGT